MIHYFKSLVIENVIHDDNLFTSFAVSTRGSLIL